MTSRAAVVHVRGAHLPGLQALPEHLKGLRQAAHLRLREAVDVNALAQVLAHLQIHILRLQEVEDLLLVDLQEGASTGVVHAVALGAPSRHLREEKSNEITVKSSFKLNLKQK